MSLLEIVKSIFYFVDSLQAIKRTVPTVSRAASREAHCQADRGINLSAVESRKLVDRKYCFIAIGDLFTEKISHARSPCHKLSSSHLLAHPAPSMSSLNRVHEVTKQKKEATLQ